METSNIYRQGMTFSHPFASPGCSRGGGARRDELRAQARHGAGAAWHFPGQNER